MSVRFTAAPYYSLPFNLDWRTDITLATWVKPDDVSQAQNFFGRGDGAFGWGWGMNTAFPNIVMGNVGNWPGNGCDPAEVGKWIFFASVIAPGGTRHMTIKNGVVKTQVVNPGTPNTPVPSGVTSAIGARGSGGSALTRGSLAELAIWYRNLSDAELVAYALGGREACPRNPFYYWPLWRDAVDFGANVPQASARGVATAGTPLPMDDHPPRGRIFG